MSLSEVVFDTRLPESHDRLREANHRIANSLSLLAGMVQTQARALSKGPETVSREAAQGFLREAAGKIVSVAHLHRCLTEQPHPGEINLCDYLIKTCAALTASLALGERVGLVQRLSANCNVTPEQAQQIGLMVNEIFMNAIKHAHPTGISVQMSLECRREKDGRLTITVADDGIGLPEGIEANDHHGVGFKLIRSLARSLKADLQVQSDALGLTFVITLPPNVRALGLADK